MEQWLFKGSLNIQLIFTNGSSTDQTQLLKLVFMALPHTFLMSPIPFWSGMEGREKSGKQKYGVMNGHKDPGVWKRWPHLPTQVATSVRWPTPMEATARLQGWSVWEEVFPEGCWWTQLLPDWSILLRFLRSQLTSLWWLVYWIDWLISKGRKGMGHWPGREAGGVALGNL